jgi:hypothetical protein
MIQIDEQKLEELLQYMTDKAPGEHGFAYSDCFLRLSELAYPGSVSQDSGYSEDCPDDEQP